MFATIDAATLRSRLPLVAWFVLVVLAGAGCASRRTYGYCGGGYYPEFNVNLEVCDVGENKNVDMLPIPKAQIAIYYPWELRRAGVTGEVLATATIEADGKVSAVSIERASQREFAEPVIAGLPKCAFFPATKDGRAARATVHCRIQFLSNDE